MRSPVTAVLVATVVAVSCSGSDGESAVQRTEPVSPTVPLAANTPTAGVGQPEATPVTDGRGNTLIAMGSVAGGTWYCPDRDGVEEMDHFSWPRGDAEPQPQTRREVLHQWWSNTALGPHLDGAAVGNVRVTTVAGIQDGMGHVLDLTPDEMLGTFPEVEEGTVRVSVLVHDPQRRQHQGAGEVRWVFKADGWRTANRQVCASARAGEFIAYQADG